MREHSGVLEMFYTLMSGGYDIGVYAYKRHDFD